MDRPSNKRLHDLTVNPAIGPTVGSSVELTVKPCKRCIAVNEIVRHILWLQETSAALDTISQVSTPSRDSVPSSSSSYESIMSSPHETSRETVSGPRQPNAETSTVFQSQSEFVRYLTEHPKCQLDMLELTRGQYSVKARRSITQVTVSKLIDVYGYDVKIPMRSRVASWLAEITGMQSSDYFDAKTHKGFLNKDLQNRRRKLAPDNKRWVWSKKKKADMPQGERTPESQPAATTGEESEASGGSVADNLLASGSCPRQIKDCEFCQGKPLLN